MNYMTKTGALVLTGALLLFQPAGRAQEGSSVQGFSASQLEQLVAPVALYPDSLLMQVYMAATYPLEVVEADRWASKNPNLSGDALDEAVKGQDWDISVKSLCHFPEVLARMADNLDWTQDVGDAFLGQQADLLDATQRMRQKAYDSGNLKSGQEQSVAVQQDKIIVIEPSSPEVVYVPTYNPTVVYGPAWSYPSYYYPGMYYYPPGAALFSFTVGMAVGAALWGDCNWGWGRGHADVDVNVYNNYNKKTNVNWQKNNIVAGNGNRNQWQHNPEHRQGVNYRDAQTARQYGGSGSSTRISRDQARGYAGDQGGRGTSDRSASNRAQQGDRAGASQRSDRSATQGQRDAGSGRQGTDRAGTQQRSGQGAGRPPAQQKPSRDSALSGAGKSSSMERSSSRRGSASRSGTGGSGNRSASSRSAGSGSRSTGGGRRR